MSDEDIDRRSFNFMICNFFLSKPNKRRVPWLCGEGRAQHGIRNISMYIFIVTLDSAVIQGHLLTGAKLRGCFLINCWVFMFCNIDF